MTKEQAIELLKYHSFQHEDIDCEKSKKGFLGSLRPYNGPLEIRNYLEIINAIKSLESEFSKNQIDNEMISAIWGICHLGRAWGVDEDGMLRRNNLISDSDIEKLDLMINSISWTVMMLLDGADFKTALDSYHEDVKRKFS